MIGTIVLKYYDTLGNEVSKTVYYELDRQKTSNN